MDIEINLKYGGVLNRRLSEWDFSWLGGFAGLREVTNWWEKCRRKELKNKILHPPTRIIFDEGHSYSSASTSEDALMRPI